MYKLIRKIKDALKELQSLEDCNPWDSLVIHRSFYLEFECGKFKYLNSKYTEEQMNNLLNNIYTDITLLTK